MIDLKSKEFAEAFLQAPQKAREQMSHWPSELREQAKQTGVLEFPRVPAQVDTAPTSTEKFK